jgi:hypothetical protein
LEELEKVLGVGGNFRVFSFINDNNVVNILRKKKLENGEIIIGEQLLDMEFVGIIFVHEVLEVLQMYPSYIQCERDVTLQILIARIEELYSLHQTSVYEPVMFNINKFGTKLYDSAERPSKSLTFSKCTISFIMLIVNSKLVFEAIDIWWHNS